MGMTKRGHVQNDRGKSDDTDAQPHIHIIFHSMGKKKTTRGALLTANLPQLQNLIKRDPEGYRDEVRCSLGPDHSSPPKQ